MAAASRGTVKSDHAQVRRHGLWRSGASLMKQEWMERRRMERRQDRRPKRTGGEEGRSKEIFGDLVGCGRECSSDRGR